MPLQVESEMEVVSSFNLCQVLHNVPHQHVGNIMLVTFSWKQYFIFILSSFSLSFYCFLRIIFFQVLIPNSPILFQNDTHLQVGTVLYIYNCFAYLSFKLYFVWVNIST